MRLALVFINLCLATLSFGQFTYQGQIFDANTNQVIEGVNLKINKENRGAISDKNGRFQLEIKTLPAIIRISHVAYQTEQLIIEQEPQEELSVFLLPKINLLNEVTVSVEEQIHSISDVEKYSVLDFEIAGDQIFRLEYHGSFKKYVLSLTDVFGTEKNVLKLSEVKYVEGLFKSCDDLVYLLSATHAYPLNSEENQLSLGKKINLDDFNHFIRPCELIIGTAFYYVNKRYNGLMSIITRYDFTKGEKYELKVIANEEQMEHYQSDVQTIIESQEITNIAHIGDDCDNDRVRNIQEAGDFLLNVFYQPEYPIYIGRQEEKMVLLNHIEQKIEHYQEDDFLSEVKVDYVLNKKWLKRVIIDSKTEKFYGIFDLKKGIGIKEINPRTGETQLLSILETTTQNYKTIKVFDGQVFYLREERTNSGLMELVWQKL